MNTVRCSICRLRFQKLKLLYSHYLKFHSKIKIVRKLLTLKSSQTLVKSPKRNIHNQEKKRCRNNNTLQPKKCESESFIVSDNIRIFCGENEIISIGDDDHSVKLSFNNNSSGLQEQCNLTRNDKDGKCEKLSSGKMKANNKRKIKKKKIIRRKKQDYHINITKIKDTLSLDEQNGVFYTCYCRENDTLDQEKFTKCDLRLFTSDTESCSETSKNSFVHIEETKVFCNKCGSGYKTESELSEHMYIHEPFCRLCNSWFPNEFAFKQHMQLHKIKFFACHICYAEFPLKETLLKHFDSHMEEKVFGDVLEMEEEYKTFRINFLDNNYNNSINNIMCYLQDTPDMYYFNYKSMKTICNMCYKEVFFNEYERHLQMFHSF